MPGLKKLCANYLSTIIDSENVIDLIKISRTYNLPRIEVSCDEFIAKNLDEVITQLVSSVPNYKLTTIFLDKKFGSLSSFDYRRCSRCRKSSRNRYYWDN